MTFKKRASFGTSTTLNPIGEINWKKVPAQSSTSETDMVFRHFDYISLADAKLLLGNPLPFTMVFALIERGLREEFENLFHNAKNEVFESGMTTDFSQRLVFLLHRYGKDAISVLTELLLSDGVNPNVAAEALRWIGHIDMPSTHQERRWLLERALLKSHSVWIKDGAVIGLASMDDPKSIPSLEEALKQEVDKVLQKDIQQVLEQLEETKAE